MTTNRSAVAPCHTSYMGSMLISSKSMSSLYLKSASLIYPFRFETSSGILSVRAIAFWQHGILRRPASKMEDAPGRACLLEHFLGLRDSLLATQDLASSGIRSSGMFCSGIVVSTTLAEPRIWQVSTGPTLLSLPGKPGPTTPVSWNLGCPVSGDGMARMDLHRCPSASVGRWCRPANPVM